MSAQESHDHQTATPVRNESRRAALIRRQRQLLHEVDQISQELLSYPIPVTNEEVEPIIQDLDEKKTRLFLEVPEENMENVLAVYDVNAMEFTEVDGNVDAVTRKVLKTMIERGAYKTTLDLKTHDEPVALRFHIGDEHHNKSLADGMLLISSLPQATNGAQWLIHVVNGELVYSDQISAYNRDDLNSKFDGLIERSEFTLGDLEGYYLFVGDGDKLTEFLKVGPVEETTTSEATSVKVSLETSSKPASDYLAKIGPQGRIRHHYSTQELKKLAEDRGHTVGETMAAINDIAIDLVDDPNFVYVNFKD